MVTPSARIDLIDLRGNANKIKISHDIGMLPLPGPEKFKCLQIAVHHHFEANPAYFQGSIAACMAANAT